MSVQLHTSNGGCFHGDCLVSMYDGTQKRVRDCVKGDILENGSIIRCIIRKKVEKEVKMCSIEGAAGIPPLVITPWHPISFPNSDISNWVFPAYVVKSPTLMYVDTFYDFVLTGTHQWAFINNIRVVTLGHGMTYNDVIRHPYYGTGEVLRVLMQKRGWEEGCVDI